MKLIELTCTAAGLYKTQFYKKNTITDIIAFILKMKIKFGFASNLIFYLNNIRTELLRYFNTQDMKLFSFTKTMCTIINKLF